MQSHYIFPRSIHSVNSTVVVIGRLGDATTSLHWLPIQWRIKLKLASLTFNAPHTGIPSYLFRLLIPYRTSHVLRLSSSSNILQVLRTNLIFGSCSFRTAAPAIWNSLPDSICSSVTFNSFRRHFETHIVQASFSIPSGKLQRIRFIYVTEGSVHTGRVAVRCVAASCGMLRRFCRIP